MPLEKHSNEDPAQPKEIIKINIYIFFLKRITGRSGGLKRVLRLIRHILIDLGKARGVINMTHNQRL